MFGGDIPGLVRTSSGPGLTFGNQNTAAQYLLFVLPVVYAFFLFSRDHQEELLLAICAAVTTTIFVYTGTRAAWGGLLTVALVMASVFQVKKKSGGVSYFPPLTQRKKILIGGILLFVAAMNWIPPYFVEGWHIKGKETALDQFYTMLAPEKEAASRVAIWKNTLAMIEDHPLLGVGKGNFKIVYPLYATKRVKDPRFGVDNYHREAHNDYLEILVETGFLGLFFFLWIPLVLAWKVWRSLPGKGDPYWTTLIIVLAISVFSLLGPAFFEFPFSLTASTAFFWLFAGMLWVSCEQNSQTNRSSGWQPSRHGSQTLLVFLGISSLLFAAAGLSFLRAEFHFSRGVRQLYKGDLLRGEKEIQQARLFNPTNYNYSHVLGIIHMRMGKYPEAIKTNLHTLSLHPNYINAWNNLGMGLLAVGRPKEAELAWKRFLEIWPYYNGVRHLLGEMYAQQGLTEKAVVQFQESLRIDPGDKIAKERLEALLQERRG